MVKSLENFKAGRNLRHINQRKHGFQQSFRVRICSLQTNSYDICRSTVNFHISNVCEATLGHKNN